MTKTTASPEYTELVEKTYTTFEGILFCSELSTPPISPPRGMPRDWCSNIEIRFQSTASDERGLTFNNIPANLREDHQRLCKKESSEHELRFWGRIVPEEELAKEDNIFSDIIFP